MPSEPVSKSGISFQRMFERDRLPWILVLSLVVNFLVHFSIRQNEVLRSSLSAILDAIFIAVFLAYAVDPVLKQGLLKEGIRNIFKYLYGYSLPPALQDFYETTIVGTKVIRTDCQLHWTICPVHLMSERMSTRLHTSFGILNFTDETRSYTHQVFAIGDTPDAKESVEALYCKNTETQAFVYQLKKSELLTVKERTEFKGEYKTGHPVKLDPRSSEEKSRYRFGVRYYAEASAREDWFLFSEVTSGVEVVITVDESLQHYYFSVIPLAPHHSSRMKPVLDMQTMEYRCLWQFPRLFVPNEILIIRWQPPDGVVPSAVTTTTS
jgi:hypothetical protein